MALTACGDGSSTPSTETPPTTPAVTPPEPENVASSIADLTDLSVMERAELTVTATTTDTDGALANYSWEQV